MYMYIYHYVGDQIKKNSGCLQNKIRSQIKLPGTINMKYDWMIR